MNAKNGAPNRLKHFYSPFPMIFISSYFLSACGVIEDIKPNPDELVKLFTDCPGAMASSASRFDPREYRTSFRSEKDD